MNPNLVIRALMTDALVHRRDLVAAGVHRNWIARELDGLWRRLGLGVEIDGRSMHAQAHAFEADRERQNRLHIAEMMLIRFPVSLVLGDGPRVVRGTEAALRTRAAELGLPWR